MVLSISRAFEVRFRLASGDLAGAVAWAEGYVATRQPHVPNDTEDIVLAIVLAHTGQPEQALTLLDALLDPARQAGRMARVLEAQIVRAVLLEQQRRHTEADAALAEALVLGEPEGYCRTYLSIGPKLIPILRRVKGQPLLYVQHLLAAFDRDTSPPDPDSLTERELEGLQLIAAGATNHDIAKQFVISVGTVKSHVNHIMSKLGARNRTEAVALARERLLLGQ